MKRTLQIAIDANRVTCGKCHLRTESDDWCRLFHQHLWANTNLVPQRCAPCLAAEREAGE